MKDKNKALLLHATTPKLEKINTLLFQCFNSSDMQNASELLMASSGCCVGHTSSANQVVQEF